MATTLAALRTELTAAAALTKLRTIVAMTALWTELTAPAALTELRPKMTIAALRTIVAVSALRTVVTATAALTKLRSKMTTPALRTELAVSAPTVLSHSAMTALRPKCPRHRADRAAVHIARGVGRVEPSGHDRAADQSVRGRTGCGPYWT